MVEESNLAYHVFAIRKALGDGSDPDRYIETVLSGAIASPPPVVRLSNSDGGVADQGLPTAGIGVVPEVVARRQRMAATAPRFHASRGGSRRRSRGLRPLPALSSAAAAGAVGFFGLRPTSGPDPASSTFSGAVAGAGQYLFSISPDSRHLLVAIQGLEGIGEFLGAGAERACCSSSPRDFLRPRVVPASDLVSPQRRHRVLGRFAQAGDADWRRAAARSATCRTLPSAEAGTATTSFWSGIRLARCCAVRRPVGRSAPVTKTTDPVEHHLFPSFLSDGSPFIYFVTTGQPPGDRGCMLGDLTGSVPASREPLLATRFAAQFMSLRRTHGPARSCSCATGRCSRNASTNSGSSFAVLRCSWQTASARSSTTACSQRRQASSSTASPARSTS